MLGQDPRSPVIGVDHVAEARWDERPQDLVQAPSEIAGLLDEPGQV